MQAPSPHRAGILRLTPVAARRAHLFAAALMWSLAGLGLVIQGSVWLTQTRSVWIAPIIGAAIIAGALKARFVLDRTADTTVRRIMVRGDGRCLGGFLSWKGWALVASMVILGRALRASHIPRLIGGAVYLAIGVALLVACRGIWAACLKVAPTPTSSGTGSPRR